MNYKKYILFLLLTLVLGLNKIYAEDKYCYYVGDGFKASMNLTDNQIYVDMVGDSFDHDGEAMANYCDDWGLKQRENTTASNYTFEDYIDSACLYDPELQFCPSYLVFQYCSAYRVWGVENEFTAKTVAEDISKVSGCVGKYAGHTYKDENNETREITADKYYFDLTDAKLIGKDLSENKEERCKSLFGEADDAGGINSDGTERGPSLRYLINLVLKYIRIIVPILLLLLGSLDFAKAMASGKEDEMKKIQKQFIMRIVAAIIVFLAPQIVNLIMYLADIVWQGMGYTYCDF